MTNPTEQIIADAGKWENSLSEENKISDKVQEIYDEDASACSSNSSKKGEVIKYVPTPNFTDCGSANSQLPINFANETITILSKYRAEFDFVDFIKEKLKYNTRLSVCMSFFSEQIDALVLAIKQIESGKAFILGDMAGLGKGRICAGILRYAYVNKAIPVFITEKENLFSDMFRDIIGIGGFGGNSGNELNPQPFIMKPLDRTSLKDDNGNFIKDADGKKIYINHNDILDDDGKVLWTPLNTSRLDYLLQPSSVKNYDVTFQSLKKKAKEYDYDFNCVFLTYSVISQTRGEGGSNKKAFIRNIAKNSIIIFDECHNASGESKLGEEARTLVTDAKGVLFSSATYAKNPQSFPLYIIKTAMSEAQIDVSNIEKAIGVGGENVSEYIASVLVKEGQMIRREKDFRGCPMGNIFEGSDKVGDEAKIERDRIYKIFNDAVLQFKGIYNYIKGYEFLDAIEKAIIRKISELGIDLADQEAYLLAKSGKNKEENQKTFINENRGKYVIVKKETNTLGASTKFHFAENLFLSIKTKFTTEAVIKELHTQVDYKDINGDEKKTNRKPVIAIRATGETILNRLNLKKGDSIPNDFSEYIKAIVSGVRVGKVTFRKVNNDLYKSIYQMEDDNGNIKPFIEEVVQYNILDSDFSDNGAELNSLIESAMNYNSDMPLSPIDYMIDKIQSTQRASWDRYFKQPPNFKVGEVTARNYSLIKDNNTGLWIYSPNKREKSTKKSFNNFNSGKTDVLIINASGSTGGSIHSSEYFSDKRPRIMVITQVELNISTEVQKRGRINRSGQVNNPAYLYVLSQIPSEIRKYLSLKKKLRKLDANVSGNQIQNSNLVDIKDGDGESIEDIFNKYGEEAFNRFITDDAIDERFKEINSILNNNALEKVFAEEVVVDSGETIKANIHSFARELEIYPCDLQREFYDKMNMLYRRVVAEHCINGTYQIELSTEDLKASLESRLVRQLNSGFSEFSKPLFIEDKFCLNRRRKWSKDKLDEEITKMAINFYKDRPDEFVNISTFHNQLLEDFDVEYANYIEEKSIEISEKEPKIEKYDTEEKYNEALQEYENNRTLKMTDLSIEKERIGQLLRYFVPNKNVEFVNIVGEGEDVSKTYTYGKFIGYNIRPTGKHKYTKGSIYFKFAFIGGDVPSTELNINMNLNILEETRRNSTSAFSSTRQRSDGISDGEYLNREVNEWKVNVAKRDLVRFLSGNILSGIEVANTMRRNREIKRWVLVKYTNIDGSESTSIRLDYYEDKNFTSIKKAQDRGIEQMKISVALDNQNIIEYLKSTPLGFTFPVLVNTGNKANANIRNLINIFKSKSDINTIGIEIFQGLPDAKKKNSVETTGVVEPNDTDGNNPLYFADFLRVFDSNKVLDKTYEIIKGRRGMGVTSAYFVYSPQFTKEIVIDGLIKKGVKAKAGFSKIYKFENIDTEQGANKLSNFLNKIYEEQKLKIDFPQNISDYYTKIGLSDTYTTSDEKQKLEQQLEFPEGDYLYKLEVDFTNNYKKSLPPNFKSYEKGKTTFDKGTITLGQPIKPTYSMAYSIYPINLSDLSTVQLLLSIFDSDERESFIKDITERVERGDTVVQIGEFVSTASRNKTVPDIKYIFGKRRINEIGELLKNKVLNTELSKISYDIVDTDTEEIKIKNLSKKKDVINVEDAEKFLNYLLF